MAEASRGVRTALRRLCYHHDMRREGVRVYLDKQRKPIIRSSLLFENKDNGFIGDHFRCLMDEAEELGCIDGVFFGQGKRITNKEAFAMCHKRPKTTQIFPQQQPLPDPVATDESFYSIETTASATECTGLMPAIPYTEDGRENLSELMAIHSPPEDTKRADLSQSPGMRESVHHGDARN